MVRLGDSRDGFIHRFLIAKATRLTTGSGIPSPSDSRATCLNRFIEYYRRNFANNPDQSTHDLGNRSADRLSKAARYRLSIHCDTGSPVHAKPGRHRLYGGQKIMISEILLPKCYLTNLFKSHIILIEYDVFNIIYILTYYIKIFFQKSNKIYVRKLLCIYLI